MMEEISPKEFLLCMLYVNKENLKFVKNGMLYPTIIDKIQYSFELEPSWMYDQIIYLNKKTGILKSSLV